MFDTNDSLIQWLNANAEPALQRWLPELDEDQRSELRKVYNDHCDLQGKTDIGQFSTLLGRAIPGFMEVAKKAPELDDGPRKKAFVTELIVAHFRLLDRGPAGGGHHFMQEHAEHLPQAFPNGPEVDYVRPMADQAIETCYEMLKRMKNPEQYG